MKFLNKIKHLKKIVFQILIVMFSMIVLLVILLIGLMNLSSVRESVVSWGAHKWLPEFELSNISSPKFSVFNIEAVKYDEAMIEAVNIQMNWMSLFAKKIHITSLEVGAFSLDDYFNNSPSTEPLQSLEEYAEYLELSFPINIDVDRLRVDQFITNDQSLEVIGELKWNAYQNWPNANLSVSIDNKRISANISQSVINKKDESIKSMFDFKIDVEMDQLFGYQNIKQTSNGRIVFNHNNTAHIVVYSKDSKVQYNNFDLDTSFDLNAWLSLDFNKNQKIKMDLKVNEAVVILNSIFESGTVDSKLSVDALDVKTVLPYFDVQMDDVTGKIQADMEVKGNISSPNIMTNIVLDGFLKQQPMYLDFNVNNIASNLYSIKSEIKSSFLNANLIGGVDLKNSLADLSLDIHSFNELVYGLKLIEIIKPFDRGQFFTSGNMAANIDFSKELGVKWTADLKGKIIDEKQYLDVSFNAEGNLDEVNIKKITLKNLENTTMIDGHYHIFNDALNVDAKFNLTQLKTLPFYNEFVSDVALQKIFLIDENMALFYENVLPANDVLNASYLGQTNFVMNAEQFMLNDIEVLTKGVIYNNKQYKLDFNADFIDLELMDAINFKADLTLGDSKAKAKGLFSLEGENDFVVDFTKVDSVDIQALLMDYDFHYTQSLRWWLDGQLDVLDSFDQFQYITNLHAMVIDEYENETYQADIYLNAVGDLNSITLHSFKLKNNENTLKIEGEYSFLDGSIDIKNKLNIQKIQSIPWVYRALTDLEFQKWVDIDQLVGGVKSEVYGYQDFLNAKIKGGYQLHFDDELFKLKSVDLNINTTINSQNVMAEIQTDFIDLNNIIIDNLNLKITHTDMFLNAKGTISLDGENDVQIEFDQINSDFVIDILGFYGMVEQQPWYWVVSGAAGLTGTFQAPNIKIHSNNYINYESNEVTGDINIDVSGEVSDPTVLINVKLLSLEKDVPIKLVIDSRWNTQFLDVNQFHLTMLDHVEVVLNGQYVHDFLSEDLLLGQADFNYVFDLNVGAIYPIIKSRLNLDLPLFLVEGEIASKGRVFGELSNVQLNLNTQSTIKAATRLTAKPSEFLFEHNVKTEDKNIFQTLSLTIDQENQINLTAIHDRDFEVMVSSPQNFNWEVLLGLKGQLRSLSKLVPEFGDGLSGALDLTLDASNKQSKFQINSQMGVKKGKYYNEELGLSIGQFTIDSKMIDNLMTLDVKSKLDNRGRINASGQVRLNELSSTALEILQDVNLKVEFVNAQLIDRPDVDSKLNGVLNAQGNFEKMLVSGNLDATELSVFLDRIQIIGVPEIIVTEMHLNDEALLPDFYENIKLDIQVFADKKTKVSGRGVNMALTGKALINGDLENTNISAQFDLLNGRFDLFTRVFEIEKGVFRIENDDIFVDINAFHQREGIEYYARVVGIEGRYDIQLNSNPVFDQDQLISQLMFGRTVEKINAIQAIRLARALSYLKNNGSQLDVIRSTADFLDVDNIDVQTIDGAMQLLIGKYINDKVYVQLGTSRSQDQSNVSGLINIELNENVELKTYSGTNELDSGVELFWKNDY
ncbi:translocation/assembly module TamB domain-containing protein [Marinicellulosiphila megalodicopiae]|uniref:translocation/assembly module TamB domain-containing protein n=1 Tax=Marinicellulosiphila megalodicopiae TaxID=2724896 RepID=UPI003BB15449